MSNRRFKKHAKTGKLVVTPHALVIRPVDKLGWIEINEKDLVKLDENGNTKFYICGKDTVINLRPSKEVDE